MNKTQIRELKQDERHLLKDFLYEAVFRREDAPPYPRQIIDEPTICVYIEGWGRPDDICLVALADGEVAGAVWTRVLASRGYACLDDETPELAISLFEPYRRQGIGTALMRSMISKLKSAGYRRVSLSVTKDNPACHMYTKLGFEVVGESPEDFLMTLDLGNGAAVKGL